MGGCGSISLGDTVSAEVESESCLLRAAGLLGTEVSVGACCRRHEERGNKRERKESRVDTGGMASRILCSEYGLYRYDSAKGLKVRWDGLNWERWARFEESRGQVYC